MTLIIARKGDKEKTRSRNEGTRRDVVPDSQLSRA